MMVLVGFIWISVLFGCGCTGAYLIGRDQARKGIKKDEFLRSSVERSAIFRAGFHAGREAGDL